MAPFTNMGLQFIKFINFNLFSARTGVHIYKFAHFSFIRYVCSQTPQLFSATVAEYLGNEGFADLGRRPNRQVTTACQDTHIRPLHIRRCLVPAWRTS